MRNYCDVTREMIDALPDEKRRLVFEFFFVFSRLDHALLKLGYFQRQGEVKPARAESDWTRFANDHDDRFLANNSPELQKAVLYYLEEPPKKQVVENQHLGWLPAEPDRNSRQLDRLLIFVRRVRNNLFHGEKMEQLLGGSDLQRDRSLLENGLVILYACLALDEELKKVFFYPGTPDTIEEEEEEEDNEE